MAPGAKRAAPRVTGAYFLVAEKGISTFSAARRRVVTKPTHLIERSLWPKVVWKIHPLHTPLPSSLVYYLLGMVPSLL
jgi:hypothetical protein